MYPEILTLSKPPGCGLKYLVSRLIWSRLHHQDIDLSYSSVFDRSKKSDSKLFLSIDKKVIEFSDVEL